MLDITDIDLDLNRCEKVLRKNDYMEIVIAIEELQDKYRNKIDYIIENENNIVWNYSKKDLENIEKHLVNYKKEMIQKEKSKNICEKLKDLRIYIKDNDMKHKEDIKVIINLIEEVNNKNINLEYKYEELKVCFDILKNIDRKMSIYILELVTLVIK